MNENYQEFLPVNHIFTHENDPLYYISQDKTTLPVKYPVPNFSLDSLRNFMEKKYTFSDKNVKIHFDQLVCIFFFHIFQYLNTRTYCI